MDSSTQFENIVACHIEADMKWITNISKGEIWSATFPEKTTLLTKRYHAFDETPFCFQYYRVNGDSDIHSVVIRHDVIGRDAVPYITCHVGAGLSHTNLNLFLLQKPPSVLYTFQLTSSPTKSAINWIFNFRELLSTTNTLSDQPRTNIDFNISNHVPPQLTILPRFYQNDPTP